MTKVNFNFKAIFLGPALKKTLKRVHKLEIELNDERGKR